MEHFSGMHNWYACSHARPTFCNVCREALPGVTSHGLSCEGTQTHTFRDTFLKRFSSIQPFSDRHLLYPLYWQAYHYRTVSGVCHCDCVKKWVYSCLLPGEAGFLTGVTHWHNSWVKSVPQKSYSLGVSWKYILLGILHLTFMTNLLVVVFLCPLTYILKIFCHFLKNPAKAQHLCR